MLRRLGLSSLGGFHPANVSTGSAALTVFCRWSASTSNKGQHSKLQGATVTPILRGASGTVEAHARRADVAALAAHLRSAVPLAAHPADGAEGRSSQSPGCNDAGGVEASDEDVRRCVVHVLRSALTCDQLSDGIVEVARGDDWPQKLDEYVGQDSRLAVEKLRDEELFSGKVYGLVCDFRRYATQRLQEHELLYVVGGVDTAVGGKRIAAVLREARVTGASWALMAPRLLIASGYWCRKQHLPLAESELQRLATTFPFAYGTNSNLSKEQLIQRLLLDERTCDPQAMAQNVMQLQRTCSETKLRRVTSTEHANYLANRSVRWSSGARTFFPHTGLQAVLSAETTGTGEPCVVAISGESGSGKTMTAIATVNALDDAACIYTTADIFRGIKSAGPGMDTAARNHAVCDALVAALGALVRPGVAFDGAAVVIIDELGDLPDVVRALCAIRGDPKIAEALKVRRVVVVAVGTGVDGVTSTIGSNPATYVHERMTSAHVLAAMTASPDVAFLFDSSFMRRLALNARLAACMIRAVVGVGALGELTAARQRDVYLGRSMRDALVQVMHPVAMRTFKQLNGLGSLTIAAAMRRFAEAFALACGGPTQTMPAGAQALLRTFGLLTDNAEVISGSSDPSSYYVLERSEDGQRVVVVPRRLHHRYAMTAAAVEMGLRGFGFAAAQSGGWDGFEGTMAQLLYLHAWAAVCAIAARIEVAPMPVDVDPLTDVKAQIRAMAAASSVTRVLLVTLDRAVTTWDAARAALEDTCARECPARERVATLVVARNKALAPFADLIVGVVAQGACGGGTCVPGTRTESLLLIQLKHYTTTSLSVEDAWLERHKMGCRRAEAVLASVCAGMDVKEGGVDGGAVADALRRRFDVTRIDTTRCAVDRNEGRAVWFGRLLAAATHQPDQPASLTLLVDCVEHWHDRFVHRGDRSHAACLAAIAMSATRTGAMRVPHLQTIKDAYGMTDAAAKGARHILQGHRGTCGAAEVFERLKMGLPAAASDIAGVPAPCAEPAMFIVVYHPSRDGPDATGPASRVPGVVTIDAANRREAFYPTGWESDAADPLPCAQLRDVQFEYLP